MPKSRHLAKIINKGGRKPRAGIPRYPSGQIRHRYREPRETEKEILATALAQPHRRGTKNPRSAMWGYALGRMFLFETITQRQYDAAEAYTKIAVRYYRDVSGTLPRFPSMLAERISSGPSESHEPRDDIASIRKKWEEVQVVLMGGGEHALANTVLTRVCIMDRDIYTETEVGSFRAACNALARLWKM